MRAIDMCRLNKYDTPDLVYGRYDGTVIKRLFAAFSFRPTVVLSVPTPQVMSINPYFQTAHPVVSSISMINLRLPEYSHSYMSGMGGAGVILGGAGGVSVPGSSTSALKLTDALDQSQLFFENGSLLMKKTEIIFSRGVLVFFVDRRKHRLDLAKLTNPANMVGLPSAISGFERINDTALDNECTRDIDLTANLSTASSIRTDPDAQTSFRLRSVVCAKTADTSVATTVGKDSVDDLFIGSKALVGMCAKPGVPQSAREGNTIIYDPMAANRTVRAVTHVNENLATNPGVAPIDKVKTHGVIFVFAKN
jgi:hypothetical protein